MGRNSSDEKDSGRNKFKNFKHKDVSVPKPLLRTIGMMLIAISTISAIALVARAESTQQFNNIRMTPYYFSSIPQNTNQTMFVNIDPPDNILTVLSALFHFKVFTGGSTTNYTLYVNDKLCGSYFVDTAFANSGQYEIAFDCTSLIRKAGNYTVKLMSSRNAGSFFGWLDLTYMNNPSGLVELKGTEYQVGDRGTVFLQLKDANGNAINTGNCYLNVYYPDIPNATKPIWIDHAPMMHKTGSNGLYFYDFYVPNITGVYMIDAECSYIYTPVWYYLDKLDQKPIRTVLQGTYIGDTSFLNDYEDWLYTICNSGGGATKYCEAYYDFTLDNTNITSLDLYWSGESRNNPLLEFYVWNWTDSSWVKLPNNATLYATGSSVPIGVGEMVTNAIPDLNNTISGDRKVRIKTTYSLGTSFIVFDNWLGLKASKVGMFIIDVKGSGELHVNAGNLSFVGEALSTFSEVKYAGATEYQTGDEGYLLYQFLTTKSGQPSPVNNADWCNVTVWYPNGTIFINNQTMTYLTGSHGLYQINFTAPNITGVYKTNVMCKQANNYGYGSSTFHVTNLLSTITNNQQTIYNYQQAVNQSLSNQISATNQSIINYIATLVAINYTWFEERFTTTWNNQLNYYTLLNNTITTFHNLQMSILNVILNGINTTLSTIYNWFEYKSMVIS